MRRFNLYVVWEVSKLFVVALVAFTTMIMLAGVVQQLISQGLGPWAVLEMIPYVLPISLQFAIPATLLFAVCSVYGRISADNEILAVMAAGVPPIRFIAPTLIASFFLSLCAVWLNDIAVSWGAPGINRIVMHSVEQVAYNYLASQGSYSSDQGLSIHVHGIGGADGRELIRPTITFPPQSDGTAIEITAASARLTVDPVAEELKIDLVDMEIQHGSWVTKQPGESTHRVKLSQATKKGTSSGRPTEYAMREIGNEKKKQQAEIEQTQETLAARTAMGLAIGKFEWLSDQHTWDAIHKIAVGRSRLQRLKIEPWRRWASGFSCLFFVWVGIPLSIWMRSADHWTSFGACFLPILLLFYPAFMIGLNQAKDGHWPAAAVWLGNLILLLVGAWWLRKIYRS
jgi:lipopolysaccharide export system permease protein